jgi:cytoskeletal protein CcmA (bactofilin family)
MFGAKKSSDFPGEIDTIIGKNTTFKGNIIGGGTIRVDGKFEGELQTTGALMVGETAQIKAQVKAKCAMVSGMINGNVEVQEKLELYSTGKLFGDVKVGTLIIGEGAVFRGSCEMKNGGAPELKETAAQNGKNERK